MSHYVCQLNSGFDDVTLLNLLLLRTFTSL